MSKGSRTKTKNIGRVVAAFVLAATSAAGAQRGAGPTAPSVEFSPDPVDFGLVGPEHSGVVPLTVTNSGGSDLVIVADRLIKGNAPFYIMADGCAGRTLGPGASCAIQLEYAPPNVNYSTIHGYLVLFDNATGGHQEVLMYGWDQPK
jgi:hypothetical protein